MAATKDDLRGWFLAGQSHPEATYRYMIVVCDTFSWDDYPVYAQTKEEALFVAAYPGQMQKVMEVYDLTQDMEDQMAEHQTWHL